jgi:hypothetical protein
MDENIGAGRRAAAQRISGPAPRGLSPMTRSLWGPLWGQGVPWGGCADRRRRRQADGRSGRRGASRAERKFGFRPNFLKSPNSWNTFALLRLPLALLRLPELLAEFPLAWFVVQRGAGSMAPPREASGPAVARTSSSPGGRLPSVSSGTHHPQPSTRRSKRSVSKDGLGRSQFQPPPCHWNFRSQRSRSPPVANTG